ncbi:MAG: tRNA uridine-5-carboxymethylaminomethyl(34) synthesis GTPase MnmE, partial [Candidatus Aminicenantes bacterium]|nr:tRNA uridine-5-carboxymethylaminomethyl(34) synthesis GTPase MnmE [Candidatus Aminicenantes bacterium]
EKEGIKRGKNLASQADGILLLFDASQKETPEDLRLIKKFKDKKTIFLFNKIDLPQKMNKVKVQNEGKSQTALEISALKGINNDKLKEMIHDLFVPNQKQEEEVVLHLRQKLILEDISNCLTEAQRLLEGGHPEEVYSEEIRKSIPLIGQLTGEIRTDDIIEDIFSRFCVGK